MDNHTFKKINEFCDNVSDRTVSQTERDFVIRKYSESYISSIESKIQANNNQPLTQNQLDDIRDTLLNNSNMENYVIAARDYYQKLEEKYYQDFKKKNNGFWLTVGVNLISNFIYSFLIIILFIVARDQISSWISSLKVDGNNPPPIEQQEEKPGSASSLKIKSDSIITN
ncbi:hypothetical protein FB479_113179 [Brevibacillus sp. AG162]|uniref:hypothetical protein n=1 Tax=Brevibacillus sp. AG162 TaxID=2572910 RepID=UPI001153C4CF|nr:hypothetical protein [Brevibacillus sp. AG162]TQK45789.1 hypothetical protein FB479_113179 [Brevibacillus sp. AG162]